MIKSEIKKLPKSEVEINITVDWEDWKSCIDKAVKQFSEEIKIEGFRAGKAPRNMVEQKVGSAALFDQAAQIAVRETYAKVIGKEKIAAIGSPKAEIKKLAEGNPLEYMVISAVVPTATLKPWKKSVAKVNSEFANKKIEVTEKEIEEELKQIANSRVQLEKVEREAKDGDTVIIDFEVLKDGVPIEHGTSKNHPLILGKGVFIPGFEENVIGMKAMEEKEFELTFPSEYHEKSLAGNTATFKVKVNEVQERKTPAVDEAFAKSLGKFENLSDLKKNIIEGLTEEKSNEQKEKRRAGFIDALIENTEVELPHVLIHEELHKMLGEFEVQLQGMGMDLNGYFQHINKTQDDIEKEWEPQAIKRLKAALALEEAAKEMEIEIPQEKIEEEMNKTLAQYKNIKDVEKNIDLGRLYTYVKGTLTNEEVFKKLEDIK